MNCKNILKKVFFPSVGFIVIFVVLSAVLLISIFVHGLEMHPFAYVVYVLSFYSFIIFCVACFKTFPKYYKMTKTKMNNNKYINKYFIDITFKTHVNLYRSLIINLLYVLMNMIYAYIYKTWWFFLLSIYYLILSIMRFILTHYIRKNGIGKNYLGELKSARICAIILLSINLVLSGAILMMIYFQRGFEYQGYLIYVIAMYTFYTTITAIRDIIKYRKYNSPIISASNMVKLAASLVSVLTLETAMLSQFGADTSITTKTILIEATGAGISIIIVTMATYFIIYTNKEIRKYKEIL